MIFVTTMGVRVMIFVTTMGVRVMIFVTTMGVRVMIFSFPRYGTQPLLVCNSI